MPHPPSPPPQPTPAHTTAIWKFTFYWTLILVAATFEACALLAMVSLFISRTTSRRNQKEAIARARQRASGTHGGRLSRYRMRQMPPLWLLLIIPLAMGAIACFVSLVSGTVVGFALAAVYSAGGFSMSTWVPFLWGMIQVVVLIIA